jgi:uridine kinase
MPNSNVFILLAGPNGAGKSTVMKNRIDSLVQHYANPDKDPFNPKRSDICRIVLEKENIWRKIYPDSFTERCASTNLKAWFNDPIKRSEGIGIESIQKRFLRRIKFDDFF